MTAAIGKSMEYKGPFKVYKEEVDARFRQLREDCSVCREHRWRCPEHMEEWLRLIHDPLSLHNTNEIEV